LESDLFTLPLDGADVSFGALKPGEYVLSSTYLRLITTDAASAKFWEVMGPILEDLSTREGLAGLSLGLSLECNSARTLSIWRDDVSMLEFVASSAHLAAVAAGSQLNRGGSVVMHWTGNETQATWEVAAQKLAEYDGPTL
jgi:heme-degrading monooxygenase HmoA